MFYVQIAHVSITNRSVLNKELRRDRRELRRDIRDLKRNRRAAALHN